MKTAILGGSFNPVHIEHVELAIRAIKELNLDKLIVMPTYFAPHKSDLPAPADDRLNMLKIAFSSVDKVEVSDFEIANGGKSYTYLTVEHFKEKLGGTLYFICGADMLIDFKTWKNPDRILSACTLAVFGREGVMVDYNAEENYLKEKFSKGFYKLSYVGKENSSTEIRTKLSLGLKPSGLDEKVYEYIKEKGLYKGDVYEDFVRSTLPEKRLIHTANVVITALSKAKELGLDKEKVRISAVLHDCAKYIEPESVKGFSLLESVPKPVIHAFLGAFIAKEKLKITDEEIISAIKYHTTGKADMTTLEKLIFVADMIEEGRNYDGVNILRKHYQEDFEKCFNECIKEEYIHLQNRGGDIYFETENAYNYYVKEKN